MIMNYSAITDTTCKIQDYEGNLVYEFPKGACAFTEHGEMFHINSSVNFFSEKGEMLWTSEPLSNHHSVMYQRQSGELAILTHEKQGEFKMADSILIFNRKGEKTFHLKSIDILSEIQRVIKRDLVIRGKGYEFSPGESVTHFNSAQILGENPLENKIPAFKRNNILVSCYLQSLIFIIDRSSGKIVWAKVFSKEYSEGVHTPQLLKSGSILMFSNRRRYDNYSGYKYSALIEYNPLLDAIDWEYTGSPKVAFLSDRWGSVSPIGDDQYLVSYSTAGIAFQVDRDGRILWEYHTPPLENGEPTPMLEVISAPRAFVDPQIRAWRE